MEDPDLLVDLRALNLKQSDKYNVFWKKCESYLQECTAVHERRHDNATYLARAISVRDLLEHLSPPSSFCACNFIHRIHVQIPLNSTTNVYLLR